MAMVKCSECQTEVSSKAESCPKCGNPNPKANHLSGGSVLGTFVVVGLGIWWFAGGGFDQQVSSQMSDITSQVAQDAVNQYNIAKQQGDPIQICVQAGFVSAAYLQAQDQANYNRWKSTEAADCERAGIPR